METNINGHGTYIFLGECPSNMSQIRARAYLFNYTVLSKEESELLSVSLNDNCYLSLGILVRSKFGGSGLCVLIFHFETNVVSYIGSKVSLVFPFIFLTNILHKTCN